MKPDELTRMLRQTLEDDQLSRGERKALAAVLEERELGPRELDVCRSVAFDVAREAAGGADDRSLIDWLEGVIKVLANQRPKPGGGPAFASQACFSPGDDCPMRITQLIDASRRAVDICVFTITDNRITDAIMRAHRRGIRLRIISDNDKSNDRGSDIDRLAQAGLAVRLDRSPYHMHHKFAIFDGAALLTGSYNWTRSAASDNEENFVITADPSLLRPFAELFDQLWDQFG